MAQGFSPSSHGPSQWFWPGLACPGFGPGFSLPKPEPDEAKPKPWFPGQAKPAQHYSEFVFSALALLTAVSAIPANVVHDGGASGVELTVRDDSLPALVYTGQIVALFGDVRNVTYAGNILLSPVAIQTVLTVLTAAVPPCTAAWKTSPPLTEPQQMAVVGFSQAIAQQTNDTYGYLLQDSFRAAENIADLYASLNQNFAAMAAATVIKVTISDLSVQYAVFTNQTRGTLEKIIKLMSKQ
ncbi:hypothetical protein DFH06DRAFT_1125095 [Mycena polygramma]|nr:hypothetical protein DFH06DRAFT_1125095 [Mycena polygramma]